MGTSRFRPISAIGEVLLRKWGKSQGLALTPRVQATDLAGTKKLIRFHQIDGLRALAVLIVVSLHGLVGRVVIYLNETGHVLASDFLKYFFNSGVELFFVISGVVLLRPYLRGERSFDYSRYFKRRIQRLWPPYLVALVFTGIIVLMGTRFPNWFSSNVPFKFSWFAWLKQLFILNIGTTFNGAWWSLNIEIIFYLLIPFLIPLLIVANKNKFVMLIILLSLMAISEIVNFKIRVTRGIIIDSVNMVSLFVIYLPCFFSGILLASYDFHPRVGYILSALGIIYALIGIPLSLSVNNAFALIYFGLVIISFDNNNPINKFLKSNIMIWLGERSYSIFLIHFTIFYLTNYIIAFFVPKDIAYLLLSRLIGLPAALLFSMILFSYVEKYFARGLVTADSFWFHPSNATRMSPNSLLTQKSPKPVGS
jgi:peptidoglycan/LPS O-acetylase OafA/YrhL